MNLLALAGLAGTALMIGFTGAMSPGPFLTVTITETCTRGRRSALALLGGHALLEAAILVGFAFGLQRLLKLPAVSTVIAFAGGAFLLWMGVDLLRGVLTRRISLSGAATSAPLRFGPVVEGAFVSGSNPYWWLWWATIGAKLAVDGLAIGPLGVLAFYVGHELADLTWYGTVVFAVHSGRGLLSDRVYRTVLGVCATFLAFLGASFVLAGARGLL